MLIKKFRTGTKTCHATAFITSACQVLSTWHGHAEEKTSYETLTARVEWFTILTRKNLNVIRQIYETRAALKDLKTQVGD